MMTDLELAIEEIQRLRKYLGDIILIADFTPGKMRDKIDTMADHAQEGLYDAERWKGAEPEYKSFKKSLS
jgi:hypothetical protein